MTTGHDRTALHLLPVWVYQRVSPSNVQTMQVIGTLGMLGDAKIAIALLTTSMGTRLTIVTTSLSPCPCS